jgi:hypothetical protein
MDTQDRRQRASWARWDARLSKHERKISDLLRAEREQVTAQVVDAEPVDAEPVAEPVGEPHAEPVPPAAEVCGAPDAR